MEKRVPWDEQEAVLLVDTYDVIRSYPKKRKELTEQLSNNLRRRGQDLQLPVDDIFRNYNGINMRLLEINKIFNPNSPGLYNTSNLFRNTVKLFQNNRSQFDSILESVKQYRVSVPDSTKTITDMEQPINNVSQISISAIQGECFLRDKYGLNPDDYKNIKINNLDFSARLRNALIKNHIYTLNILLMQDELSLKKMKGMGSKCINELYEYLLSLAKNNIKDNQVSSIPSEKNAPRNQQFVASSALTPYYKSFNVDPRRFSDVLIEQMNISTRLKNGLMRNGVVTLEKLLKLAPEELLRLKSVGKTSCDEVWTVLGDALSEYENNTFNGDDLPHTINSAIIKKHFDEMANGDFSWGNGLDESSLRILDYFKEIYETLGSQLMNEAYCQTDTFKMTRELLVKVYGDSQYFCEKQELISKIPYKRLQKQFSWIITCYTDDTNVISSLSGDADDNAKSLLTVLKEEVFYSSKSIEIKRLLTWLTYDVHEEIDNFFKLVYAKSIASTVIKERAKGKTLEAVGLPLNITRERVRQIEKRVVERFLAWQSTKRILFKLFLDLDVEQYLSATDVSNYLGEEYGSDFVYLAKKITHGEIILDKDLDAFVISDKSLLESIQDYVDSLPDSFNSTQLNKYLTECQQINDYPVDLVTAVINSTYSLTGNFYHRVRLTLTSIYADIFKRYYPNGMHVYDHEELVHFKKLVEQEYGISVADKSDRSIIGILTRIGILCGRGIYKLKEDKKYISKDLVSKIREYIRSSEEPIILMNTLFSVFEEDLLSEGIDNKYFLQGALRDSFQDEWIFKRDYISKDSSYTSLYGSIVKMIKDSPYPVKKDEIRQRFPGITEIVLSLATNDISILNYFGEYFHTSNLRLSTPDISYLKSSLTLCLADTGICNVHDVFNIIMNDRPELLQRNFIMYPFGLFSLYEYLFNDYNYSRPLIARDNVAIDKVEDAIRNTIKEMDTVLVDDLLGMIRDQGYTRILSILDLIDSCNETHFLINNEVLASIEKIGITEEDGVYIENMIDCEISKTVAIGRLECINQLPKIGVEWNAWLIYSVLKRWSTKLDVAPSSNQFKLSYPLVAPKGQMKVEDVLNGVGEPRNGKLIMADNLDNIDELIELDLFE